MVARELHPADAVDRFLSRRRGQSSSKTVRSYSERLEHFVAFCEEHDIESMSTVDGWTLDEFYHWRSSQNVEPVTVKGTMATTKQLLKFCADLEVVDPTLPDRVPTVTLSKGEESSDVRLETERAKELLAMYRDSTKRFGTSWHATLELAWHSGARLGGMLALDIQDFDPDMGTVHFQHRPDQGTRLKNGYDGERIVELNPDTVDVLEFWIARERPDTADEYGREPLFATYHGRASESSIRSWCYLGTQPCLVRSCPHGRVRRNCEYTERQRASTCPSSRSPHAVRTGSITWQLGQIEDIEIVAERVNAAPSTIRRYYDVATPEEKFDERRRGIGSNLDITTSGDADA